MFMTTGKIMIKIRSEKCLKDWNCKHQDSHLKILAFIHKEVVIYIVNLLNRVFTGCRGVLMACGTKHPLKFCY